MVEELLLLLWMFGCPILLAVTLVLWAIWWLWLTPKTAKELTKAARRNLAVAAVFYDDGYVELALAKQTNPAGAMLETKKSGKSKDSGGSNLWMLPAPIHKLDEKRLKEKGLDKEAARNVESMALRKYILKDLKVPFWVAYAGKAVVVNPATIAAYQQGIENPKAVEENKQEDPPNDVIQPVKPEYVREIIPQMYTCDRISYEIELRERAAMGLQRRELSRMIMGGGMLIALLIFGVIALQMFMR